MPESCIVILDPSEYMRNGDYIPSRYEAQQDAARWLIADITTTNAESTVGVVSGGSVIVSTTNNIGQLFQAIKSSRRHYTKDFDLETSLQLSLMALKHRRSKIGSQRIILFIGSPVLETNCFTKLSKTLRKNNVALQIITLGEEPSQEKLEGLLQNSSRDSRMIHIPKGSVPSEFLSATATFSTSSAAPYDSQNMDPSMDPELAMALRVSMEEERTRQGQFQTSVEDAAMDDEATMMQQALEMSVQEKIKSSCDQTCIRSMPPRRSGSLAAVEEDTAGEANDVLLAAPTDESLPSRGTTTDVIDKDGWKVDGASELTQIQIVDQILESQDEESDENFLASLALEQEMEKVAPRPVASTVLPQTKTERQDSLVRQHISLPIVLEEGDGDEGEGQDENLAVHQADNANEHETPFDEDENAEIELQCTLPVSPNEPDESIAACSSADSAVDKQGLDAATALPSLQQPPQSDSSSNWSPINRELDEYYTASSGVDGHDDFSLQITPSDEQDSALAVQSCWSNLDEAFDDYNTAINEISNFLPVRETPRSPPPRQEEEERQDIVSREEYTKLADELAEAKKAMTIMQGMVTEKNEMIVALREIMGMMQQERKAEPEPLGATARAVDKDSSASEREITETLIDEIQKKNRNLESLRRSLTSHKHSGHGSATAPVTPSITEKRRKKRELENMRAKHRHSHA